MIIIFSKVTRYITCFSLSALAVLSLSNVALAAIPEEQAVLSQFVDNHLDLFRSAEFDPSFKEEVELFRAADYEEAIQSLVKKSNPKLRLQKKETLFLILSLCRYFEGDLAGAVDALSSSRKERAANADAIYVAALYEISKGKAEQALNLLEEALWFGRGDVIKPDSIYVLESEIYTWLELKEKSSAMLSKAVAANPQNSNIKLRLAQSQLDAGNRNEAIRLFRDLYSQEAPLNQAKLGYANSLLLNVDRKLQSQDVTKALSILAELHQSTPSAEVTISYINALLASNNPVKASAVLDAALKNEPNDPQLLHLQSQIALETKTG